MTWAGLKLVDMDDTESIRHYLIATGWSARHLAARARLHESALSHVLAGRRCVGELAAIKLERASRSAYDAGETSVPPLRLSAAAARAA
jgi:hypothetical protein